MGDRGTLGLVKITSPSVTFGGIQGWRLNPNIAAIASAAAGQVDPTHVAVMDILATLGLTTLDLSVLSSFGINGAELTTADFYIQKLAAYGVRAGSSDVKITAGKGLMVPRTITVSQGARAELSLEAFAVSTDGETASVAVASGTMPAGGAVDAKYTLGPVTINGTTFDAVAVTVDFGIDVRLDQSDGYVYPTFACIMARRPSIRITASNLDAISIVGVAGLAQDATDSVVAFRQLKAGGARWADNESKHVTLTIDDGMALLESGGGDQDQRATSDIVITPVYDGTNAIIAIATDVALT